MSQAGGAPRLSASAAPGALVVRFPNWLGDVCMALPVLAALKRLWPGTPIAVQVHPRSRALLDGDPRVAEILPVPMPGGATWSETIESLRARRFARGLLLTPSFSSAFLFFLGGVRERIGWRGEARDVLLTHPLAPPGRTAPLGGQYLDMVRSLGYSGPEIPPAYEPPPEDRAVARAWMTAKGVAGRRPVALAPAALHGPAKRWPAESFRALAEELVRREDTPVVVLGAAGEAAILDRVGRGVEGVHLLPGVLGIRAVAALIAHCRALIGNDTGLLHLARAVGTPVIGLYGPSSPVWTGIGDSPGEAIHLGLPCSPCFKGVCPLRTGRDACLSGITVERVLSAFRSLPPPAADSPR